MDTVIPHHTKTVKTKFWSAPTAPQLRIEYTVVNGEPDYVALWLGQERMNDATIKRLEQWGDFSLEWFWDSVREQIPVD